MIFNLIRKSLNARHLYQRFLLQHYCNIIENMVLKFGEMSHNSEEMGVGVFDHFTQITKVNTFTNGQDMVGRSVVLKYCVFSFRTHC